MYLSRIHHQHVSIAIATICGVTYKNIRNASNLSKHLSDPTQCYLMLSSIKIC